MDWRRIASLAAVAACSATLGLTSCGKKEEENNGSNNGTNNGTTVGTNNGTNVGTNNGTSGTNNGTTPVETAEFGLEERPSNTTCVGFDRPPSQSSVTEERGFPNVSFSEPLALLQSPDTTDDRWFVMEQSGRVMMVASQDANTSDVFVDISGRVTSGGERGLLGIAFHPQWPATPEVFLSYTAGNESRISRFTSDDSGATLNPDSEQIILTLDQPYSNHNGGGIDFGPDGMLYIGFGDGGSANDPEEAAQDLNQLLGKFLRIAPTADGYDIPADNPFANGGGSPEIWAWGLRNPWRWSFDMETGTLWAGDVGQNEWEEINIIEKAGNYGWDDKEASRCFEVQPCEDGPWIDPVVEYDHSMGRRSVTGGFVYRGDAIPSLQGVYIFGDYASGHVYGVFDDADGNPEMRLLFQHGGPISTFGQGRDGEVFLADYGSGTFHKIIPDGAGETSNFPRLLSETGCMSPDDITQPASGLVPYGVNAPFWSDGAEKERYMALPDGETITVEPNGDWTFPQGTVIVKSFRLGGELIETRLLVHHADGDWGGYSYEWNADGTDAVYAAGGKVKDINGQQWVYPSSGDCMQCHTQIAGRTLGPENRQLDGDFTYASTNLRANQLKTLGHIGMFAEAPDADVVEGFVDPFGTADVADRARAYLHTNCAQCHRSGTAIRPKFDLTATTNPLIDDELCNAMPIGNDFGNAAARRLIPGDAENSLMIIRMNRRDANQMPPIGSTLVDAPGVSLITEWINGLGDCQL